MSNYWSVLLKEHLFARHKFKISYKYKHKPGNPSPLNENKCPTRKFIANLTTKIFDSNWGILKKVVIIHRVYFIALT
jgi:hypothetical protein